MSWTNGARIAISLRVMGMKGAEIVAKGTTEEDEVISCDCDLSRGEYMHETIFNFAKHCRREHYALITERAGMKIERSNHIGGTR